MTFGQIEVAESEHTFMYGIMKDKIKIINNALKGKEWLCGEKPTIADI